MRAEDRIRLDAFLDAHPDMRVRPSPRDLVRLSGTLAFHADFEGGAPIQDEYQVQIDVPLDFPKRVPRVQELDGRIPREVDHHVFPSTGVLCLGSPLQLGLVAHRSTDLADFVWRGIVPYLYAASYREQTGGPYPFGELAHGPDGLLDDYARILRLSTPQQASDALRLLGLKRRLANKRPCPCGCGRRLGTCRFNETVRMLRQQFGRHFFQELCLRVLPLPARTPNIQPLPPAFLRRRSEA